MEEPVYTVRDSLMRMAGLKDAIKLPSELIQSLYPDIASEAVMKLDAFMPSFILDSDEAQQFVRALVADLVFDSLESATKDDANKEYSPALSNLEEFSETEMVERLYIYLYTPSITGAEIMYDQKVLDSYSHYVDLIQKTTPSSPFWKFPNSKIGVLACLWSFTGRELMNGSATSLQAQLRGTTKNMIVDHENCARNNAYAYMLAVS